MAKFLLVLIIVFTILIAIISVASIWLGVWLIKQQIWYLIIYGITYISISGYILTIFGSIFLLSAIIGCCGAVKQSKCCVGIHFAIVLITVCSFASAGFLLYYKTDVASKAVNDHAQKVFAENYSIDEHLTSSWNEIQVEYKCCGPKSPEDYRSTKWFDKPTDHGEIKGYVPNSCCKFDDTISNVTVCNSRAIKTDKNPQIYQNGCLAQLAPSSKKTMFWTAVACFVFTAFLGIVLILLSFVCCRIHRGVLYGQVV